MEGFIVDKEKGNLRLRALYLAITKEQRTTDKHNQTVSTFNKTSENKYWVTYGKPARSKLVTFEEAARIQKVYPAVSIVQHTDNHTSTTSMRKLENSTEQKKQEIESSQQYENPVIEPRHSTIDSLVSIPDITSNSHKRTGYKTASHEPKITANNNGMERDSTEIRVDLPDELTSLSESKLLSAVMLDQNRKEHIETDEAKFGLTKTVPIEAVEISKQKINKLPFFRRENHMQDQTV